MFNLCEPLIYANRPEGKKKKKIAVICGTVLFKGNTSLETHLLHWLGKEQKFQNPASLFLKIFFPNL